MNKTATILLLAVCLTALAACDLGLWTERENADGSTVSVERYDRLESRYLTTGDFSALQTMSTTYPMETRTLIENVLELGTVDEADINSRLLKYYQDTTLQAIIAEAATQYAVMDDINEQFRHALRRLEHDLPGLPTPEIYAQIGALNQSVIIGDGTIGICLDKYLGADFAIYRRFYPPSQRATMSREHIVPDCLAFYILSLYPLHGFEIAAQRERDRHIGHIQWLVNRAVGRRAFDTPYARRTAAYMRRHPEADIRRLLREE